MNDTVSPVTMPQTFVAQSAPVMMREEIEELLVELMEALCSTASLPRPSDLIDSGVSEKAIKALTRAERDLRDCIDLDRTLVPKLDLQRSAFRRKLQRHYFTNIVAAGVMRALWSETGERSERVLPPQSANARDRVLQVIARCGETAQPVTQADCWAFLAPSLRLWSHLSTYRRLHTSCASPLFSDGNRAALIGSLKLGSSNRTRR